MDIFNPIQHAINLIPVAEVRPGQAIVAIVCHGALLCGLERYYVLWCATYGAPWCTTYRPGSVNPTLLGYFRPRMTVNLGRAIEQLSKQPPWGLPWIR